MKTVKPESAGLSSVRLQRLSQVMQTYIDNNVFAGIVTLLSRHGQVAGLEAFGWQEKETNRLMTVDTIFRIYSMTKPVTSVAVMMLCEEGKIRLADPVSRYIPGFKDARVMVARGGADFDLVPSNREMTIHDLLTHSGGLAYGENGQSALDAMYRKTLEQLDKQPENSLEKMVNGFVQARLPLAFQPGTGFRYSLSIDILGYIVQLASGKLFEDFLKERIFDPLGMIDTDFWVPPEKVDRFAAVYGSVDGSGLRVIEPTAGSRYTRKASYPSGGGGLVSTASDYFSFGQMLLNGGKLNDVRLLGRKTVEWMLQNHLPQGIHPDSDAANGFGLGGAVLLNPGLSQRPGSAGKFGWGGAANTEWWIDPAEGFQCILMLQYMPAFTIPIVEDFAQLAYQALE